MLAVWALPCLCLFVAACGSSGSGTAPGVGGAATGGSGGSGGSGGPGGSSGNAGAAGSPAVSSCGTGTTGWIDTISTADAPVIGGRAAYTGTSLMVIGGIYDLATHSWSAMNPDGAPTNIEDYSVVWTGKAFIVWGGLTTKGLIQPVSGGAAYDPATDSWKPLSTVGAPEGRRLHAAVWTGSRMIIWGGSTFTGDLPNTYLSTGGIYDPETDSWAPMTPGPAQDGVAANGVFWTGSNMVVAGESGVTNGGVAASYDPVTDQWTTWCGFADYARAAHAWDGKGVFYWGGVDDAASQLVASGGRAEPGTPSCQKSVLSTDGAPAARVDASAVWTGKALIVFGGRVDTSGGYFPTDDGASYDPVSDQWSPLIAGGTPGARSGHQAFWTGNEMIVWGGTGTPAGCIYKP